MSRKGRHAILLTNEGNFKSVKLRRSADVSIGQTILSRHLSQTYKICRHILTSVFAVGVSFLCILPLAHSTNIADRPVAAYLDFDLAPSIEASVDQSFRVISVRPLNTDARKVMPDPDFFEDMPLNKFSSVLIARLSENGYLNSGSLYLITTVFTGRISRSEQDTFNDGVIQAIESGSSRLIRSSGASFRWMRASMAGRAEAAASDLSTGRYLLSRQANAGGQSLELEPHPASGTGAFAQSSQFMKKVKPFGDQGAVIKRASFNQQQGSPLFQNPFHSVEKRKNSDNSSSYRFMENHVFQLYDDLPVTMRA